MCTSCGIAPRGASATAIAFSGHKDHPHDPADLNRCIDYCRGHGITVVELRGRMAGRSPQWDALLPEWDKLVWLFDLEKSSRDDGRAPLTYAAMRGLLRPQERSWS